MWDFDLGRVFGLMGKTFPFLLFRFMVYIGITLVYVVVTGGGAGVGMIVGKIAGDTGAGATYGGLIGFGVVSAALYFAREYILYLVKAGHIAVLVELMEGKDLPGGRGQVDYAQAKVKENFTQSSVLFAVDQLVKGILKTFNRMFLSIASILPIPGLQGLVKFANSVVSMSLTYVDEVILAYHLRSRADDPWTSSRQAIVLYAQNYKNLLKNAVFLTIFIWILVLAVFLLILGPVAAIVSFFPNLAGFWTIAFAAVLAWGIKAAVIDPIAMTALMQVYFKAIEGQQPDPQWDEKLDGLSAKFRELKAKAGALGSNSAAAADAKPAQQPPPAPPGT